MFGTAPEEHVALTIYTDSFIVRGTASTRHRRVSDILNMAPEEFIVLSDVFIEEWGSRAAPVRADYAQVNLGAVLFAVADVPVEATPELRMAKIPEQAFVSVPPFKVVGVIHLPPEQDMRLALGEFVGRFFPVTEATYWSDTVGEAKQSALMVAVNHARAQILAPHTDVDPWAGLDRAPAGAREGMATAMSASPSVDLSPGALGAASQPGPGALTPEPALPPASPTGDRSGGGPEAPAGGAGRGFMPQTAPSRTGLLGRVRSPVAPTDSIYDAFGRLPGESAGEEGADLDRGAPAPGETDPWRDVPS